MEPSPEIDAQKCEKKGKKTEKTNTTSSECETKENHYILKTGSWQKRDERVLYRNNVEKQ